MTGEHKQDRDMASASGDVDPRLGLGPRTSRWRQRLAYAVVFVVIFALLITVLTEVSGIVKGFFVALYTD
jgi:hypothetical protein